MSEVPSYAPEDESPEGEGEEELEKTESGVQPAVEADASPAEPAPPAAAPPAAAPPAAAAPVVPQRKRSHIFAAERPKERRRRHSRIDVQLPVQVLIDGEDEPLPSRCANLSLGGMFVLLSPAPAHGKKLRIWLSLPTGDRMMVTGTVRWSTSDGVGIQHELLGARDTFVLTQYLASLKAAPDSDPGD